MVEIDVRGLSCPIPVVRVKKAIEQHAAEEIAVIVDSEAVRENISRLADGHGYSITLEKKDDEYRLLLKPLLHK